MSNIFQRKELGDFSSYKEVLDFIPRSVWEVNGRTKAIKEMFKDDLEKHKCKRTEDGHAVSIKQKFSVFNPILGANILKIWSNIGDNVIDPFAGRDRALITNFMMRHYVGYEISPTTFTKLEKKVETWQYRDEDYNIKLHNDDGTLLKNEQSNMYDFSYSCPPYWNKEKYESVAGQISDLSTEEEWKESIGRCALNLKNCLKPNKYAAFVIADIRDKGKMIPLHCHWTEAFLSKGFALKDIIINKTNPMNNSGINTFLRNRIMQKSHEYILVFQNKK
jgi:DNA modification methylase